MIIEQAFHNLPEIMTGFGYPQQDYEGGVVGALAMALLQELNGRNLPNPISAMKLEAPFRPKADAFPGISNAKRHLRCDMRVDGSRLRVGSKRLATYGWRHNSWIECKFFRSFDKDGQPKRTTNYAVNTGGLLADVLRLGCLVPVEKDKSELCKSGRYLLHVYANAIGDHILRSYKKKSNNSQDKPRPWVAAITTVGKHLLTDYLLSSETPSVLNAVGKGLKNLKVSAVFTNYILEPQRAQSGNVGYVFVLTRIDGFKAEHEESWFEIQQDRSFAFSNDPEVSYRNVSDFVGQHISQGGLSDQIPPDDEIQNDDDAMEDADK